MLKILLSCLPEACVVSLIMAAAFSIFVGEVNQKALAKGEVLQQKKIPLCSQYNYSSACYNRKIKALIRQINKLQKNITWSRFQVSHENHSDFWIGNYKTRGAETFFYWGCLISNSIKNKNRCARRVFSHDYIEKLTKPNPGDDIDFKLGNSTCSVSQTERVHCHRLEKKRCKDKNSLKSIDYLVLCKKITSGHVNKGG